MGFLAALCIFFVGYRLYKKSTEDNNVDNTTTYKRTKKKEYKPPVITCDYCGSKVDTAIYDRCPNCGATYDLDSEWINRFENAQENDDYDFSQYSNTSNNSGRSKANSLKKKKSFSAKLVILIIVVALVIFVVVPLWVYLKDGYNYYSDDKYRTDEMLNEYSYEDYQLESYSVEGDGQILNYFVDGDKNQNVTVTLKNIYKDHSNFKDGYKLELEVVNNSDTNVKIILSSHTFNDFTDYNGYLYASDNYKKHSTVTVYEDFSNVAKSEIKNIYFDKIEVLTLDSDSIYECDNVVKLTTTSTIDITYDLSRYHIIYSNDYVDIYSAYDYVQDTNSHINYDEGLKYYIVNKTEDLTFDVDTDGYLGQGKSLYTYGMYDTVSIPGTTLLTSEVYSYDDYFTDVKNKELYISFNFKCRENPIESFSTGYIDLKTEYWRSEG